MSMEWHVHFWRWCKDQVVGDVPEDIQLCQFDCDKECTQEEWEACARRLSKAAGELMPLGGSPEPKPRGGASSLEA
jgi:hypothetical protein